MKTFVISAVSIVLVGILFCPMAMAAPTMPADLQIVQPDPSLQKELSAFFGKWESTTNPEKFFVIVEKIDEEKASLYIWFFGSAETPAQVWTRREAQVIKEGGKYKLWWSGRFGNTVCTLKGENLIVGAERLRRVP